MSLSSRTTILALGNVGRQVGMTLTLIFLVRLVSPDDVGTYRQVWMIYNSLYVFLVLGLPGSIYYHLAAAEPHRHRSLLRQTALLLIGLGSLFALAMTIGAPFLAGRLNNDALRAALPAIAPYAFFSAAHSYGYSALVVYKRAKLIAGIAVVFSWAQLSLTVAVLMAGASLVTVFLLMGLLAFIRFVLTTWLVWREAPEGNERWAGRPFREQIGYSTPYCLSDAVTVLQRQMDKIVVSLFCLPEEFAKYSLGAVPLPFVSNVRSAVFAILLSEVSSLRAARNTRRVVAVWQAAVRKTALIFHPLMAGGLASALPFISLLYTSTYHDAVIPFRIYLLTLLLFVYPAGPVALAFKLNWFQFAVSVLGLIITAVAGAVALPILGLVAPAIGALVALAVMVALQLWRIAKELDIGVGELAALRCQVGSAWTAAAAAVPCCGILLLRWPPLPTIALQVLIYAGCYVLLVNYAGVLTDGDRRQLREMWTSLRGISRR